MGRSTILVDPIGLIYSLIPIQIALFSRTYRPLERTYLHFYELFNYPPSPENLRLGKLLNCYNHCLSTHALIEKRFNSLRAWIDVKN